MGNVQPADKRLPSTVSDEGTVKTTSLTEGSHGDKDSKAFKPPANMEPLTTPVADPLGIDAKYQDDQTHEDEVFKAEDEMDEEIHHTDYEETQSPSLNKDQPESSHAQDTESDSNSFCPEALKKYDNVLPVTERQLVQYLQKVSWVLYNRLTEDQWEKHMEAAASYADLNSKIKGFHDVAYKVHKGTKAAFSTYERLIVKFQSQYGKDAKKILGSLKVIPDAVKEDPALNKKGQQLLGENFTHADTEEPLSHTKGENDDMETQETEVEKKPMPASPVVRQDPDEPMRIPYEIYEKLYNLTNDEIQEYLNKEEDIKKKVEQARLLAMTKPEIIKLLGRKRTRMELEPEICIPALECNISLPEGVPLSTTWS
uniref:Uncharacterized protein n=1 Tax=Tanacetum cinerariifolium TaxID=118510 RepID=A0A6L2MYH7_TANCI|nr:hypothetical protein [Tanacetum cinerariifolium]